MNAISRNALNAYSQIGVETSIANASPHKLISMLFEGAILAIGHGKIYMQQGQAAAKGESLSKAIAIIDEGLNASLDEQSGGELAQNLKALYEYMANRLLTANIQNDVKGLDEVSHLLGELKGAWDELARKQPVSAPPAPEQRAASARPSMSYGKA